MMCAIPNRPSPDVYPDLNPTHSAFVALTRADGLGVRMQYPRMGMRYAVEPCYVRREVRKRLQQAQQLLPEGIYLCIWDAWRPFALQQELYETYAKSLMETYALQQRPTAEREAFIAQYVSYPKRDSQLPPVHTTGGAVDVTLVDVYGRELSMGTAFDSFGEETGTSFFEDAGSVRVRDNRRLLYHVMTEAGFTNLPSEWWHFDYGDRFWAFYNGRPAMYEGVFTLEEVTQYGQTEATETAAVKADPDEP